MRAFICVTVFIPEKDDKEKPHRKAGAFEGDARVKILKWHCLTRQQQRLLPNQSIPKT